LLTALLYGGLFVDAPRLERGLCRDPLDEKFIDCAVAGAADFIVSGDKDLLSLSGKIEVSIVRPRDFLGRHLSQDA
jgi:predicted nucleic acid-binding protein